ncbi:MAG TPA: hypothetical protein VD769_05200 [Gaiellaceae bacterium]|nr:hypothetical protein [Gaiellaceae bacterium]
MRRGLSLFGLVAVVAAVAVPASAVPPTTTTTTQQAVLANPTACGSYGVEWRINLTSETKRYFDSQGRLTHIIQHITEDNTIRNTVTGLTLREGPDDFHQTTYFDPETGQRTLIYIRGVSVYVERGDEVLVDKGKIWIDGQTGRIIASTGPHPLRELLDGSFNIALALPGFCDILRP